jgi:hypothetical protein
MLSIAMNDKNSAMACIRIERDGKQTEKNDKTNRESTAMSTALTACVR